jgi:hypothetical protein
MNATHTSSECTNVPGNSPAMMRVNTEAITSTVQRFLVLSLCGRQAGFNVVWDVERPQLHYFGALVHASGFSVFVIR